jgi:hypothetical protein
MATLERSVLELVSDSRTNDGNWFFGVFGHMYFLSYVFKKKTLARHLDRKFDRRILTGKEEKKLILTKFKHALPPMLPDKTLSLKLFLLMAWGFWCIVCSS